jgi:hypothetical protein
MVMANNKTGIFIIHWLISKDIMAPLLFFSPGGLRLACPPFGFAFRRGGRVEPTLQPVSGLGEEGMKGLVLYINKCNLLQGLRLERR